jgi:hypothetical protein
MNLKNWFGCLREYDSRRGGLGYLWLFGCVPSVLALLGATAVRWIRRKRRSPVSPTGYEAVIIPLLTVVALGFIATPNNWWARYTLWVYGLGLPAFAVAVQAGLRRGARFWAIRTWTAACVGLLVFEALYSLVCTSAGSRWKLPEFWHRPSAMLDALLRYDPVDYLYAGLRGSILDEVISDPTATVGLFGLPTQRQTLVGQLAQPIGERKILLLSRGVARDPAVLRQYVRQHQVRYIIGAQNQRLPLTTRPLIDRVENAPYDFRVLVISPTALDNSIQ